MFKLTLNVSHNGDVTKHFIVDTDFQHPHHKQFLVMLTLINFNVDDPTKMMVSSSGYVNINTTSPVTKLHVNGNIRVQQYMFKVFISVLRVVIHNSVKRMELVIHPQHLLLFAF